MKVIADLHVHSKYARATSPRCDIRGLSSGAKIKGIQIMASGDFTHPSYFNELRRDLAPAESGTGLYEHDGVHFILSTELCVSFELNGKNRRMHHVVLAPSLEIVAQMNERLSRFGNLSEDGRPTLSISCAQLAEELFSISKDIVIIPAHAWTPWFSIFGSKAGVNSVEEAFEDQARNIFALETGLSSDPSMNWMLSALDRYSLVSNSDAHSLEKLGREANVFELETLTYRSLIDSIRTRKGFLKTYEFYPEEGKYHYDGHRDCHVIFSPFESKSHNNLCPVCRKKLTIGVLHRVSDLADRKLGFRPDGAVPFQHIVPLTIVISKAIHKPETSVAVLEEYSKLIRYFGSEFAVYESPEAQLRLATSKEIADALARVNSGKISWVPGYDGVFGQLMLDDAKAEARKGAVDRKQKSLDDF
ncbi:MAG: endonuclease Q family protein [Candidatus Micrarchaeota archaeon]